MKKLGLLAAVVLLAGGAPLFGSSLCTGTLQDLLDAGVCNFDLFSVQVLSFSTTGSTIATPLSASQITFTATALTGDAGASVVFGTTDGAGPFLATGALPGTSVSAQYHITYAIIAPNVFLSELLTVGGGTISLPANYSVTKTAEGITAVVTNFGRQSSSAVLPADSNAIIVSDDIVLNASTTRGGRLRPPVVGSARISSVSDQFAINPPAIPEPVTCLLCGSGLLVFGFVSRRRRRK